MLWFAHQWTTRLSEVFEKFPDTSSESYRAARKKAVNGLTQAMEQLVEATPQENELIQFVDWFSRADASKNAGLYTDFVDGRWRTPASVDRMEFETALRIVGVMLSEVGAIQRSWESTDVHERKGLINSMMNAWKAASE